MNFPFIFLEDVSGDKCPSSASIGSKEKRVAPESELNEVYNDPDNDEWKGPLDDKIIPLMIRKGAIRRQDNEKRKQLEQKIRLYKWISGRAENKKQWFIVLLFIILTFCYLFFSGN